MNEGTSVQSRVLPVPLSGEFGATSHSLVPHDGEVSGARKILGHSNRSVQIEDNMPPSTYMKHGFQPQLQSRLHDLLHENLLF